MTKDRRFRIGLGGVDDVVIFVERSSAHPIEYAVRLCIRSDGRWRTIHLFDNAHGSEEHHEHRYVGSQKQPPLVTRGPVNAAIAAAISRLEESWHDIVHAWEIDR